MTRLLAYIITITFFSASLAAQDFNQNNGNYVYEHYNPPERKVILPQPQKAPLVANSQYKGEHDKKWHKENSNKNSHYILFDTNYTMMNIVEAKSAQVIYPALSGSATVDDNYSDLDYEGDIHFKGALGLGLGYGYMFNDSFALELESSFLRFNIVEFDSDFSSISLDGGNYLETGPEVITDVNDYVKAFTASANIVFSLNNKTKFTPFAGLGYGSGLIGVSSEFDANPFMLYKAGISYDLSDNMNFYLAGKYYQFGKVKYPYKVEEGNVNNTSYDERKYILEHDFDFYTFNIGYVFKF